MPPKCWPAQLSVLNLPVNPKNFHCGSTRQKKTDCLIQAFMNRRQALNAFLAEPVALIARPGLAVNGVLLDDVECECSFRGLIRWSSPSKTFAPAERLS